MFKISLALPPDPTHVLTTQEKPVKATTSSGPVRLLQQFGRALLGLLYPPLCLGCEARLPEDATALPLCLVCLRRLPRADTGTLRPRLDRLPGSAFGHAFALWLFDEGGTLQQIQHALKYGNRPTLGVQLGRLIGEAWREAGHPSPDHIVPVPLHRPRRLERGYNQSERLAAGIAETLGAPLCIGLLKRTRPTRSQTALSQSARWHNVDGAFGLRDATDLTGKQVLLVDDVFTTGATAVAAAAPLRSAGATVDFAALACTRE